MRGKMKEKTKERIENIIIASLFAIVVCILIYTTVLMITTDEEAQSEYKPKTIFYMPNNQLLFI